MTYNNKCENKLVYIFKTFVSQFTIFRNLKIRKKLLKKMRQKPIVINKNFFF